MYIVYNIYMIYININNEWLEKLDPRSNPLSLVLYNKLLKEPAVCTPEKTQKPSPLHRVDPIGLTHA